MERMMGERTMDFPNSPGSLYAEIDPRDRAGIGKVIGQASVIASTAAWTTASAP